ncbi:hypothetical protein CG478_015385 [Bacillus cytotoxicus]|nr:hypothetical protein CG483_015385 [Bacillus cytotoxicus]AWC41709.1 hypothetical protein CG480_015385 [Bacillus cytotoxicus]AWC49640.1 hypothetical protein CG478_015385 [Bacillus cytotoxicus]AWC53654.1 hypothetical protein CG477_015345 [Bacillus cytotoxicus]AWC57781.1 hypothetical protein CG476_015370 [Bacillus cytotoxicus]
MLKASEALFFTTFEYTPVFWAYSNRTSYGISFRKPLESNPFIHFLKLMVMTNGRLFFCFYSQENILIIVFQIVLKGER